MNLHWAVEVEGNPLEARTKDQVLNVPVLPQVFRHLLVGEPPWDNLSLRIGNNEEDCVTLSIEKPERDLPRLRLIRGGDRVKISVGAEEIDKKSVTVPQGQLLAMAWVKGERSVAARWVEEGPNVIIVK